MMVVEQSVPPHNLTVCERQVDFKDRFCALIWQLYTVQTSNRSQMISQKFLYNPALSAELPCLAYTPFKCMNKPLNMYLNRPGAA